jgi:NAD-dependent SIR2 family protein deacetylase
MAPHGDGAAGRGKVSVPPELARDVEGGKAVLFAGTGISLAAGLPRSPAFIERLAELVRRHEGSYTASPVGSAFVSTATDLEVVGGRPQLTAAVAELVKPPQGVRPTAAHRAAVRTFDRIITTNFDCLFEDACAEQGIRCTVVRDDPEIPERFPGGPVILKLHGSVDVPSTLALTEEDFALFARKRPRMCRLVVELLRSRSVLVVGTSLRDPSIIALFAEAGDQVSGFFVVPNPWNFTPDRVKRWNLRVIPTDADTLFDQLAPGAIPLGN